MYEVVLWISASSRFTRSLISSFIAAKSTNLICIVTPLSFPASVLFEQHPAYAGRMTGHHRMGGHIARNQSARADHRTFSNGDAAHNDGSATYRSPFTNSGFFHLPVALGLERAVPVDGARKPIVDKNHAMSDEHPVLDHDARADKGVAGDLAALADPRLLLNLDEGADAAIVADLASVEVYERRKADVFAELDVIGHTNVCGKLAAIHRHISPRSRASPPAS